MHWAKETPIGGGDRIGYKLSDEHGRRIALFFQSHTDSSRWFVRPGVTQQDVRAVIALARHYNNPPRYHVVVDWLKNNPN